jgi:hypothetical protein
MPYRGGCAGQHQPINPERLCTGLESSQLPNVVQGIFTVRRSPALLRRYDPHYIIPVALVPRGMVDSRVSRYVFILQSLA